MPVAALGPSVALEPTLGKCKTGEKQSEKMRWEKCKWPQPIKMVKGLVLPATTAGSRVCKKDANVSGGYARSRGKKVHAGGVHLM